VTDDAKTPFHNPFASLKHLRGDAPAADTPTPPAPKTPAPKLPPGGRVIPRAVVRLERTGRGGKEVTVVEQLNLNAAEREQWLKALKSGLGCGGSIEGDSLMIQGDQRKRLPVLLTARGVKKVIVS
jgi:translation initiation factor 1